MSLKIKAILLPFLLIGISFPAQCSGNYTGPEYEAFLVKVNSPGKLNNNLYENISFLNGNYTGWTFSLPFSRTSYFSLGIGLKKISYRKEIEGVFPETNQYGLALINGHADYWSFPISVCWMNNNKTAFNKGLRISYMPSIIGSSGMSVKSLGGAIQSTYVANYQSDNQVFQHSIAFFFCNQVFPCRGSLRLNIDPYIGLGTGFFKSDGSRVNNISCGVNLSLQFKFRLPHIYIEKEHGNNQKKEEQKKLLEKKQKEIEEQLMKKPK